jgi:chromate transporter
VGGPKLAFLTMLVWALPVIIIMTTLSFLYQFINTLNISSKVLRFVGPMAVGFIILAAFRIGKKVVVDRLTFILMIFGALVTYFIRSPWIFPTVLLFGGAISIVFSKETNLWNKVKIKPPWKYLILFIAFAIGTVITANLFDFRILDLFDSFYRFGYLVFGGGQVVVPVMHGELVEVNKYLTSQEFLTGYGLVQGMPGPLFSFSAYAGGMAAREFSTIYQILSALVSALGIFLPGLLLIYFIYPVWENVKKIKAIKISLKGINAVAGGLIAIAAVILMQKSGLTIVNSLVTIITIMLLGSKRIPAPLIVLATLIAGFVI